MTFALKNIYAQARPLWLSDDILPWGCKYRDYGNPSGHALSAVMFGLMNESTLSLVIGMTLASLTAISRVVLGVHSINQIVFGSLLGIWLSLTFRYVINDKIKERI